MRSPKATALVALIVSAAFTLGGATPGMADPGDSPPPTAGGLVETNHTNLAGDGIQNLGSGLAWLDEINLYRVAAGLDPVVEEPAWTAALMAHLNYLNFTPWEYFTGEYANRHRENPASPYYTPEGDQAGRSSNLVQSWFGLPEAVTLIDTWLTAPFHGVGILRPDLKKVAFASSGGWAGLNVGQGLEWSGPTSTPVLFPGPGVSTNLTEWPGLESPNPLETCGWGQIPFGGRVGTAIIAMLPQDPAVGLTATLVADNGPDFSTAAGSLCRVDMHTYFSSDPVYGPTGASILAGGDHPVFLIAAQPLTWSRYHVTVSQPGQPDISWSFVGTPPYQPAAGEAVVLHVTDSGADTVIGNLTVTEPGWSGFTTVYPCLEGRPLASNNNYVLGQTIPNLVVAKPDANGDVCLYTSAAAHLIWDQVGETSAFATHAPTRLVDTRQTGKLPAGGVQVVHVTDSGADTVIGNLTVTEPSGAGFTTVYPCLEGRPVASNNNYVAGQTIPNLVVAKPDADGDICLYTSTPAHLIWDQVAETDAFATHGATRLVDTRQTGKLPAGGFRVVHVSDGPQTVIGNLTVTEPAGAGFTTVYPCLEGRPLASNNNYVSGETIPNLVMARSDANGDVCLYTSTSAHLIWDQVAETGAFDTHLAQRLIDTRLPAGRL